MEGVAHFVIGGKVTFDVPFPVGLNDSVAYVRSVASAALLEFIQNNHTVAYSFREKKVEEEVKAVEEVAEAPIPL